MKFTISRASDPISSNPQPDPAAKWHESLDNNPFHKGDWKIEISILDDLLSLIERVGAIVIDKTGLITHSITIYDDYME